MDVIAALFTEAQRGSVFYISGFRVKKVGADCGPIVLYGAVLGYADIDKKGWLRRKMFVPVPAVAYVKCFC